MSDKRIKIVFDTNSCRSDAGKHDQFFGYRDELEKLSKSSEIVIPSIVIEEIASQKRRTLVKKRNEHLSNPFIHLSDTSVEQIKSIDIDKIINQLIDSETMMFSQRDLKDKSGALVKIHNWSINKQPPFSSEERAGDKGFKDAYIACVIEEMLDEYDDEYFIFFTKDELLISKFKNNPRVKIVSNFDQIPHFVVDEFIDEYLLEKIQLELEVEHVEIINSWLNIEENWVIEVVKDDSTRLVIIDSQVREILDTYENDLNFFVKMLTNSGSFEQTHSAIEELSTRISFLSQRVLLELIDAAVKNDQILWIAKDEDVKQFYQPIYDATKDLIDPIIDKQFKESYIDTASV